MIGVEKNTVLRIHEGSCLEGSQELAGMARRFNDNT